MSERLKPIFDPLVIVNDAIAFAAESGSDRIRRDLVEGYTKEAGGHMGVDGMFVKVSLRISDGVGGERLVPFGEASFGGFIPRGDCWAISLQRRDGEILEPCVKMAVLESIV